MIRLLLALLLLVAPAQAQQPVVPAPAPAAPAAPAEPAPAAPAASPEVAALLEVLRDEARRAELIRALEAAQPGTPAPAAGEAPAAPPAAEAPALPAPAEIAAGIAGRLGNLLGDAVDALSAATDLRGVGQWLGDLAQDERLRQQVASLLWKLLLVLGGGLLAEWLVTRALRRPRAWLERRAAAIEGPLPGLRRLPWILGNLALDLLPILAFGVVAIGTVGFLATWPSNRVIMETIATSYMAARAVMAVGRMVFAPSSTKLRLVRCDDETAHYATLWIRRLALTAVTFYALSELALFFGLPPAAQVAIWRLGLLGLSVLLAVVVMQNRTAVARLLAAPPLKEGDEPDGARRFLRGARDRLAEAWHVLAVLWLLAAWTVWALQIDRGFERLITASVMTVVIIALGKLVDEMMRRGLGRLMRISPELARNYPGLEARTNRYLPALRGILSFLILLVTLILLLEAWGLGALSWFRPGRIGGRAVSAILTITLTGGLALAIWEAANAAIQRHLASLPASGQAAQSARVRTLLPMLRTALGVVLTVVFGLTTLSEVGVNVAPLLAGAGVVGLAVGFGSQTLVRDVITGIFLLFEDAVAVGDSVTVGALSGTVEQLSIRSIKLRALDGAIHIIPFSAVTTVTNQTRDFGYAVVDIPVDYASNTDQAIRVMRSVGESLREDEAWAPQLLAPLEVMGVDRMGDGGVVLRARIMTPPARRVAVGRELNRRLKQAFDAAGIRLWAAGAGREGFKPPEPEPTKPPPPLQSPGGRSGVRAWPRP
ncbi:mechanosensitive ion channel domain-containing protein [Sabulicella glaciei]|uniref:Mechanosensitive ion channel n=1 Tax=Sabulicella glaciei TaxID=2984948 RepID=A0ABT3NY01_9PROT|nr:mechanosensitive ion channel domain-containing protein [Roseococcus sp. MDT2-1-1]MCW8087048.1 mechanosensitive ion channel [Roseococcus sp. MDT2-1-1]